MAIMERTGGTDTEATEKAVAGSSVAELIAGAAGIVLPILGLVGVLPMTLAAIAFIAIGAGMLLQGGALSAQSRSLLGIAAQGRTESAELIGGMSAEVLGGAAVTALGILALLRIAPETLLAISSIVAGGGILMAAGTTTRLGAARFGGSNLDATKRHVLQESIRAAAGAEVLAGLAGIVLGILVLAHVGTAPEQRTLALVSALTLGGTLFLNGTTMGARMTALLAS
jgi:hypothetical protein